MVMEQTVLEESCRKDAYPDSIYTVHPNSGLRSPPSQRDMHVGLLHLHVQICQANESRGQPEVSGRLIS